MTSQDRRAFSGRDAAELSVSRLMNDDLAADDVRIHPETLESQAQVAETHGNPQLAANFRRAAELSNVPADELMEMYESLRPGRRTGEDMEEMASRLVRHGAPLCAALVREALAVYRRRNLLR